MKERKKKGLLETGNIIG